jgi:hypothetical protein
MDIKEEVTSQGAEDTSDPQNELVIAGESLPSAGGISHLGDQVGEDRGYFIPEMELKTHSHTKVQAKILGEDSDISLNQGESLVKCVLNQDQNKEIQEDILDNLSEGEQETQEMNLEWESEVNTKKRPRKENTLQATKQSSRLRLHGGVSVEELVTKRK